MPDMNSDRRRNLALVQGSVASMALQRHTPVLTVTIVPSGNALGFVQTGQRQTIPTTDDLRTALYLALAGDVAEELFVTRPTPGGFIGNYQRARLAAEALRTASEDSRDVDAIIEEAELAVRIILREHEGEIRRIADALLRHDTLNTHALQQVLGGN